METIIVIMLVLLVYFLLDRRIQKLEKAVHWFAMHIRIDDRDLENDPPPPELAELLEEAYYTEE